MDELFRRLPLFKGKQKLARLVLKEAINNKKDLWIKGKFGCEYLVPNLIENIGFEIFINGIYEEEISDFIAEKLPADGIFLDLGANIGAISIPLQKKRKDAKIVCVEAAPWIFKYLQQNLERNHAQTVHAINKVLFYTNDEEINFYSPAVKFGKGSLSPVFTDKIVKVNTVKLDSLLENLKYPKVDIIKIDVEGYEYHVFKGAIQLLVGKDAPDILFEFADWAEEQAKGINIGASQQILREMGYRIFYFKEKGEMEEVKEILQKGFFMLYATKNKRDK